MNYTNSELAEMKGKLEEKAVKDKLKDLEREMEDLRNRSRRNNLAFYNILEKAEGQDCAAFIKGFIKARSKRRSTHVPNQTQYGSTLE